MLLPAACCWIWVGVGTVQLCLTLPLFSVSLPLPTFVFCLAQFSVSTVQRDVTITELFLHIYRLASHWVLQGTQSKGWEGLAGGGGGVAEKRKTTKEKQNITHNKLVSSQPASRHGTGMNCESLRQKIKKQSKDSAVLKDEMPLQECFVINNAWLSIFGKTESPSEHTRGIRHFHFMLKVNRAPRTVPAEHTHTPGSKHTHTNTITHTQTYIRAQIFAVMASRKLLRCETEKSF